MNLCALFLCFTAQLFVSFAHDAYFLSDDYIERINTHQDLWQAGKNFDSDTPLSRIKMLIGARMEGRENERRFMKTFDPLWVEGKKIPKRFDSRRRWRKKCPRIAEVLDQGPCGSCWAISAAQAFTDRYCIATRGKHQMRLSTDNVLACCKDCGDGCEGGWENKAWAYFGTHGLPSGGLYNTSEGCQPYTIQSPCNYDDGSPYPECPMSSETPTCSQKCTNSLYSKIIEKDYRYAKKEYHLPANEQAIMKDIMAHGPVTAAFEVRDDFVSYKSGVYVPGPFSTKLGGGHAVKLIGWGVEKKVPYWLVMNSWNDYWGDHGLVKMKRNCPEIELETDVWAAEANVKRRYQYEKDEIASAEFKEEESKVV